MDREQLMHRIEHGQGGNPLAVQGLRLQALTDKGLGSISGQGTKIPQGVQHGPKKRKECGQEPTRTTWYSAYHLLTSQSLAPSKGAKQ